MSTKQDNILDELKGTGASVLKISKETGIPANRMYKWYEGKGSPKYEDVQILRKWLNKLSEEVTNVVEEPQISYKGSDDRLAALIKSNQDLAESNKALARSHERLVEMLALNSGVESKSQEVDLSMFRALIEGLAQVGADVGTWGTVIEGKELLGKIAAGTLTEVKPASKKRVLGK